MHQMQNDVTYWKNELARAQSQINALQSTVPAQLQQCASTALNTCNSLEALSNHVKLETINNFANSLCAVGQTFSLKELNLQYDCRLKL